MRRKNAKAELIMMRKNETQVKRAEKIKAAELTLITEEEKRMRSEITRLTEIRVKKHEYDDRKT